MRHTCTWRATFAGVLLLILWLGAYAQDPAGKIAAFPCWRGEGAGVGPECGTPLVDDLKKARLLWESEEGKIIPSYDLLEGGVSGPVYADGKVYATWAFPGGPVDPAFRPGIYEKYKVAGLAGRGGAWKAGWMASLGVTEDELFDLLARTKMDDNILCIDAATGKTLWKTTYTEVANNPNGRGMLGPVGLIGNKPKSGPLNTPCAAYGKVAVVGFGGTLYCLDAATGKEAWSKVVLPSVQKSGRLTDQQCTTSVVYGAGNFICLSAPMDARGRTTEEFAAFDAATGEQRWAWKPGYTPMPKQGASRFTRDGHDYLMLGGACLDAATGKVLWQVAGASPGSGSTAVGEGYLVCGGDTAKGPGLTAYTLNADMTKAPAKAWELGKELASQNNCSPVIYRGHAYTKVRGETDGSSSFVAVNLATGTVAAKLPSLRTDACGSLVAGDGLVIYEGIVLVADPARFARVPNDTTVLGTGDNSLTWACSQTPCYVEGRLYVKGRNRVRCLDLRAEP